MNVRQMNTAVKSGACGIQFPWHIGSLHPSIDEETVMRRNCVAEECGVRTSGPAASGSAGRPPLSARAAARHGITSDDDWNSTGSRRRGRTPGVRQVL